MSALRAEVSYTEPDFFRPRLANWPFKGLQPGKYNLVMADPPWQFELYSGEGEEKSAQAKYECMKLEDIVSLPVADLAAPDCLLWLWATAPMLDQQIDVLKRWGFEFTTSGVWVKTTKRGKLAFGTGYVLRNSHELFLIGTRGDPKTSKSVRSVVMGERREHSRKPETAFQAAEKLIASATRCELFSRTNRPGWDVWGNETGKFNQMKTETNNAEA